MGALEASRDMETRQVASRAVPVPGPMVEQGVRAAMVVPGTRAAMVDQRSRAAMVDQGSRAAMADPGFPWAMAGCPPQKKLLGKSTTSGGHSGGAGSGGLPDWSGLCGLPDRGGLCGRWTGSCPDTSQTQVDPLAPTQSCRVWEVYGVMKIGPEPEQMIDGRIIQCYPRGELAEFPGILVEGEISAR